MRHILNFIFFVLMSACNLAPGSYPYAEEYNINAPESELLNSIIEFKNENPQYAIPAHVRLKDGRNNEKDHWYHIYFYFQEENQIIYAWTRPLDRNNTTFALIAVNEGLVLGNWKDVNKDFSDEKNKEIKENFENRILQKVKQRSGQ